MDRMARALWMSFTLTHARETRLRFDRKINLLYEWELSLAVSVHRRRLSTWTGVRLCKDLSEAAAMEKSRIRQLGRKKGAQTKAGAYSAQEFNYLVEVDKHWSHLLLLLRRRVFLYRVFHLYIINLNKSAVKMKVFAVAIFAIVAATASELPN